MFYHYSQNNSGGRFVLNLEAGIGHVVTIEADTPEQANQRAVFIGLYFDGCSTGQDCSCCGDRWYSKWNDEQGTLTEEDFYLNLKKDTDITDSIKQFKLDTSQLKTKLTCVHYKDGTRKVFSSDRKFW